jgi:hypothetical protein
VRDGKDQAPKRKSAATRFQDLQDLKNAIVLKKDKLKSKSKELCIEIAPLEELLRMHAIDADSVDAAVQDARAALTSFQEECTTAIELAAEDSDAVVADIIPPIANAQNDNAGVILGVANE